VVSFEGVLLLRDPGLLAGVLTVVVGVPPVVVPGRGRVGRGALSGESPARLPVSGGDAPRPPRNGRLLGASALRGWVDRAATGLTGCPADTSEGRWWTREMATRAKATPTRQTTSTVTMTFRAAWVRGDITNGLRTPFRGEKTGAAIYPVSGG
jgi:hypothetical protein